MALEPVDRLDLPDNPDTDPALLTLLQSVDEKEFREAVETFTPEEILPLSRALDNPDPGIRKRAAWALARHRDNRAGIVFARSWHHFDPVVRGYAAERVSRDQLEKFVPGLVQNTVSRFANKRMERHVSDLRDLIDLMRNGGYDDRRFAVRRLAGLHGYRALPALAEALEESAKRATTGYRPWITGFDLLPAFNECRDPSSAGPLLLHLQDDREAFRAASLYLLGALHENRAFEPALRLLADPSFEVRRGAVTLLGSLGDARAVPPLIGRLSDPDARVVQKAITSLGAFPDPAVVSALVPFLGVLGYSEYAIWSLKQMTPVAPDELIAAARSEDPRMRAGAVEVLQSCTDPRCIEVLTAALSDRDPGVVNAALPAFERIATPESTDALIRLGEQRFGGIDLRKLISALINTRNNRIAPVLARHINWMDLVESNMAKKAFETDRIEVSSMEDFTLVLPALAKNDDAVVQWMLRACRKLGPETLPVIRNAVKDKKLAKGAARVLLGLGYKLKEAGDREILEALYGHSRKKEDVRKLQVLESLLPATPAGPGFVDEETVRGLLDTFLDRNNPESRLAGPELARIGLPAFAPIAQALESPKTDILDKQRICAVAAMFDDAGAVDTLVGYLQDPHWGFRAAAAYALGGIRDMRALESLVPLLVDRSVNVRLAAIAALGALDDERSAKALIPCLQDRSTLVAAKACQALGDLEYPVAIPPLIAVLDHAGGTVRSEAVTALQKLSRQSRDPLLQEAGNSSPRIRAGVIAGLQACTDRRSRDVCIRALHDPDDGVREAAAGAFEKVWDPAALDHLILLHDDPSDAVRYNAACALAHSRDPRGALALARMARDRDERIARIGQKSCTQNLGKTETVDDARRLIPLLAYPVFHTDDVSKRFTKFGPDILMDLIGALRDPDAALSRGASYVLASMGFVTGDPVVAELISLLTDPDETVRERAVKTLGNIGTPAQPLLTVALRSDDPLVWQGALEAIDLITDLKKTG